MTELIEIKKEIIIPSINDVMKHQGIPEGSVIKDHVNDLFNASKDFFIEDAHPLCMIMELTKDRFEIIYNGEGNNEDDGPIKQIFQNSDNLALYAITLGRTISQRITELFDTNEFALASMLDSSASVAVDNAVGFLEKFYYQKLSDKKLTNNRSIVFGYSPGYCGWNIDAQKKLFRYLHPGTIGISLNESCLMTPLKSVTGVLIHGDKTIHEYRNSFGFCVYCKTESCLERAEKIFNS